MIEFNKLTDRLFSILKQKISKEVFKEDYIDYYQLKKYVQYLKYQPLLQKSIHPVIISLSKSFHAGENLDREINELHTYQSMFHYLIEYEFIKKQQQVDNKVKAIKSTTVSDYLVFEPPFEYEIIKTKEFHEFTGEIRKATMIFITQVRLVSYIEGKLDEISDRGQLASSRVSKILRDIQSSKDKYINLIDNTGSVIGDDNSSLFETPEEVFNFADTDIIDPLFKALILYFDEKEHDDLLLLLKSKSIDSKIIFKGSCKTLCYPFRQLHLHSKLTNKKKTTINWICNNFKYMNKGMVKECDINNVKNYLSRSDIPFPKAKRIKIDSLEHLE